MREVARRHAPSKAPANLSLRRCASESVFPSSRCPPRRLGVLSAVHAGWLAALLALAATPIPHARAQGTNLLVDQTLGNSPYSITTSASYNSIEVGTQSTGQIDQSNGAVTANYLYVGSGAGSTGTYNLSGGSKLTANTLVVGSAGTGVFNQSSGLLVTSSIIFGQSSNNSSGTYNLSGGILNNSGDLILGSVPSSQGIFNLAGGTLTNSGNVVVGSASNSTGAVNLNAGTLIATSVQGGSGASTFNFNGGTLKANQDNDNFLGNFTRANVRNGGAIINSGEQGFFITISQALLHSGVAGDNATDGGLTKLGPGGLTLTGNNTYTGGTRLNAGTLNVGSAGALGTTGTLSFNGGTLQYSVTNRTDYSGRFSTAANQLYSVDTNYQNVTLASALTSQGGSLTKLGQGTLTLTGNNTYTGGTILTAGTLTLGSAGALGTTGTLTFSGSLYVPTNQFYGGTLQYSAANRTDYSARFSTAANQPYSIDTNGQNVTFASALTSSGGSLTKLGDGTLTLRGNNTYTGGTILTAGTLALGSAGALGTTGTVSLQGGLLQYSAANQGDYSARFSSAANQLYRIDTNGQNVTYASALTSQGGSLTKLGAGTLTLRGNNTYTGGTVVSVGTLNLGSAGALGTTGAISLQGGTLQYSAANQTDYSARFTNSYPTYPIDTNGQNVTFATGLAGNNTSLTKLGAGTLTLTGNNTYRFGTVVSAGTLAITAGSVGSTLSSSTLTVDGGAGNPAATLSLSGASTTLTNRTATVGSAGSGVLTQNGGSHTVVGTLFVGTGGGTGTYNLSGGTLAANEAQLGNGATGTFTQSGGAVTAATSLELGLNGGSGTYNLIEGSLAPANYLYVGFSGGGTGVFNLGGGTTTTGAVYLGNGVGTTGAYNLNGGTLTTNGIYGGGGTSTLTFNSGTLRAGADNTNFLGGLTTARIRDGEATFDTNGHNVTVSQNISHAGLSGDQATDGGIAKRGAGTLTFTGNNTYTGNTRIYNGTFVNNGQTYSAASTVIYGGATLGGNGFQQGNLFLLANATLAPGQAAGLPAARLTLGGTFSLATNALLSVNLAGATPGTGYDQILVSGAVTLGGKLAVTLAGGFTPALNESFTLIDQTGPGTTTSTFANAPGGLYTDAAGNQFTLNYAAVADGDGFANDVTLTYVGVVPEPGTWVWLGLGAGGVLAAWRRRSHRV